MKMALASFLTLFVLACGASAPPRDAKVAREAVYQTDFTTVWNAVSAEMNQRYHDGGIKSEDAANGVIISKWKSIATSVSSEVNSEVGVNRAMPAVGGDMIQQRVRIEQGGPPWRVTIESEGAHRSPDSPLLKPYVHGSGEEPIWVEGRNDSLREAIYDRLKQYAVAGGAPAAPSAIPGDTSAPPAENEPPAPPPAK